MYVCTPTGLGIKPLYSHHPDLPVGDRRFDIQRSQQIHAPAEFILRDH